MLFSIPSYTVPYKGAYDMEWITKPAFTVIGKMGSAPENSGENHDWIAALWADANAHFHEIAHLAKRNPDGTLCGIWGAMSDFSMSFMPWEDNFTRGLYLAGAECRDDAAAPDGWTKWVIPGHTYLRVPCGADAIFEKTLVYIRENGYVLAGAVHDFTDPATGTNYMYFPIERG